MFNSDHKQNGNIRSLMSVLMTLTPSNYHVCRMLMLADSTFKNENVGAFFLGKSVQS